MEYNPLVLLSDEGEFILGQLDLEPVFGNMTVKEAESDYFVPLIHRMSIHTTTTETRFMHQNELEWNINVMQQRI